MSDISKPPSHPGTMKNLGTVVALILVFLQAGCLAPPKQHAWQIAARPFPAPEEVSRWPELSTNVYVRVCMNRVAEAVALLEQRSWMPLDSEKTASLAPGFSVPTNKGTQPYLVRGVTYSSRPAWTSLRFDETSAQLLVLQETYDGEMLMPFRWVAEPNAFVMLLPRPPSSVYPDAWLGGDAIFRGRNLRRMDTR